MVLLLLYKAIYIDPSNIYLHSNMVLLLSEYGLKAKLLGYQFTFQYGSTFINPQLTQTILVVVFTFQYGSTFIELRHNLSSQNSNLHSNMVLLL